MKKYFIFLNQKIEIDDITKSNRKELKYRVISNTSSLLSNNIIYEDKLNGNYEYTIGKLNKDNIFETCLNFIIKDRLIVEE